jgi:hypothetical protein
MMRFLVMLLILVLTACSKEPEKTANTKNEPVMVQSPTPQEPEQPRLNFVNLKEAIVAIKPTMSDTVNEISQGAALLALWSANNLNFSDFDKMSQSKYSLIMKDPDEERGKLLCTIGSIIEIQVEKADGNKFYNGGLVDHYGHIYRFIAVRSTGDLVAGSVAHFCGVVTGKQSYANSVGGMAHAVFLVGMFVLPENKKDIRPVNESL